MKTRFKYGSLAPVFLQMLEQHEPHGRNRCRDVDLLGVEKLVDALAVHLGPRHYHLAAGHRCGEDERPGVGVKTSGPRARPCPRCEFPGRPPRQRRVP